MNLQFMETHLLSIPSDAQTKANQSPPPPSTKIKQLIPLPRRGRQNCPRREAAAPVCRCSGT